MRNTELNRNHRSIVSTVSIVRVYYTTRHGNTWHSILVEKYLQCSDLYSKLPKNVLFSLWIFFYYYYFYLRIKSWNLTLQQSRYKSIERVFTILYVYTRSLLCLVDLVTSTTTCSCYLIFTLGVIHIRGACKRFLSRFSVTHHVWFSFP